MTLDVRQHPRVWIQTITQFNRHTSKEESLFQHVLSYNVQPSETSNLHPQGAVCSQHTAPRDNCVLAHL